MSMRNRTPTAPSLVGSKVRSPIARTNSRDKAFHANGKNAKTAVIAVGLALLGLLAVALMGSGSKASTDTSSTVTMNPNSVRRLQPPSPQQQESSTSTSTSTSSGSTSTIEKQMQEQLKQEARKAAQEHHDRDQANVVNINKNAEFKDGKLIVRDADGDIVEDDMLAKDIAAGRDVDLHQRKEEEEETDVAVGENRWKNSNKIPQWLKEYFEWHVQVTAQLNKDNWREQRYLVMTCLGGEVCGNVAHRLRPIMAMLRVAADSKRVFCIHWDLPDRLEKYLHPPQHGGIDWIVPEFIMWKIRKSAHQTDINIIEQQASQDDRRVVNVMYNDDTFAEPYYNDRRKEGEKAASEVFKDTWNVLFKPSFMLTERVTESLRLMGLGAGEYAAAHIDYDQVPQNDAEQEELRLKVEHAMNCLSKLRPGGPYFVAAQTYPIAREAIVYGNHHNVVVHSKQIAHDTSTVPTDLFTSFVEIMLMANARCVAFNRGGYGQLGYLLGYNYNCRVKYSVEKECQWVDPPPATEEREKVVKDEK
ncbi:expressed unknown protein [Seminavis robusta]|uniref:Uncharacterized protein n=1 Tax=Seminavis robusta TaxID=568900 RepID=A0A9N8DD22_9STRA|nr:expressed unknown protein [Seminavis robusta]|eukprot:Sro34_g022080.1 n/a (531) ;mRNA; r:123553-125236